MKKINYLILTLLTVIAFSSCKNVPYEVQVVDQNGNNLEDAEVLFNDDNETLTNEEGLASFESDEETMGIGVSKDGYASEANVQHNDDSKDYFTGSMDKNDETLEVTMYKKIITLNGHVYDQETELPISNASVIYSIISGGTSEVFTDEAGDFTVSADPNGTLSVWASGYLEQEVQIDGEANIDIALGTSTILVEGYVYESGTEVPLEGVTVQNSNQEWVMTNSDGLYYLTAEAYSQLNFSKTGYYSQFMTIADQTDLDNVYMELSTFHIAGYVFDSETELPVAGATVQDGANLASTVTTDGNGYFEIYTLLASGQLNITAGGYQLEQVFYDGEESIYEFYLTPSNAASTFNLYVYHGETNADLNGVLVVDASNSSNSIVTAGGGFGTIELTPPNLTIDLSLDGFQSTQQVLMEGQSNVSIALYPE